MSKEKGIDLMMIFEHSVNIEKFQIYLDKLRLKYPKDKICIYLDNL